jgi:hypothetical protein
MFLFKALRPEVYRENPRVQLAAAASTPARLSWVFHQPDKP